MTIRVDSTFALKVSSAYEGAANGNPEHDRDREMDLANNEQGAMCGDAARSPADCVKCCLKKLSNGSLRVDRGTDITLDGRTPVDFPWGRTLATTCGGLRRGVWCPWWVTWWEKSPTAKRRRCREWYKARGR